MERRANSSENTRANISDLIVTYKPEAIAIFSGGIVRRERNGHTYYSTTSYKDSGMGGKARVHAAAYLAKEAPHLPLLALSSVDPHIPTHAEIIREELLRKGITADNIISAPEPYNTFTEVLETYQQAKEHNWKDIVVISNDYHGDRIQYMYEHAHELADLNNLPLPENELRASFVAAEDILSPLSHHYQKVISEWRNSPQYRARTEQEHQGLEDLINGTYMFTSKKDALVWEKTWEKKIAEVRG